MEKNPLNSDNTILKAAIPTNKTKTPTTTKTASKPKSSSSKKTENMFQKTSKNDILSLTYYLVLLALPVFIFSGLIGANLLAYANNSGGSILTTMFSNMDVDSIFGYYGTGIHETGKFYDNIYKWLLTPVTSNNFNEVLRGNYTNASFVDKYGLGLYLAILINTIIYLPLSISWFVILYKLFELMNFQNIWSIGYFVLAVLFIGALLNIITTGTSMFTLMFEYIFVNKSFRIVDIWKANKNSLIILLITLFGVGAFLYLELIVALVSIFVFGPISWYALKSMLNN